MSWMGYLFILAFAAVWSAISYFRDLGRLPFNQHVTASILWGLTAGAAACLLPYSWSFVIAIALVTGLGMFAWVVSGWGLYFGSFDWTWHFLETEIKWIDAIGYWTVPFVTNDTHWTNGLRGVICMSLRGLYILPLFFMLQMLPWGIAIGLSQGIAYGSMRWLAPAGKQTNYASVLYVFVIGIAVASRLIKGF